MEPLIEWKKCMRQGSSKLRIKGSVFTSSNWGYKEKENMK